MNQLMQYLDLFKRIPTKENSTLWGTIKYPAGLRDYKGFHAELLANKLNLVFVSAKQASILTPIIVKSWKTRLVVFEDVKAIKREMVATLNSRNTIRFLSLEKGLSTPLVSLEITYVPAEAS